MAESQHPATAGSKAVAVLVYTLLRLGLFAVVWVVIEFVSPIHGLWAAALAILISGAISIVVLDRQRGAVGSIAAGFFGRINARIEASARSEDGETSPASTESGEPDSQPEHETVREEQESGRLQRRDQAGSERAAADDA